MKRSHLVPILVVMAALVAAACGGSDDSGDLGSTSTQLTLLPTTTSTSTVAPSTSTTTSTSSSTTTSSTTTMPETTTTELAPAIAELVLSGEGIGSAEFGADPEGVISYITSFLGEPTNDSGWIDPFTIGPCPGSEIRLVDWGVLTLVFGDVSQVVQGRRHLFSYTYGIDGELGASPAGLSTERGVTIGTRVVDVLGAYPGVTLNPEDEFTAPNFYVNDNLRGYLTGLTDDSTVTVILGGIGCGE